MPSSTHPVFPADTLCRHVVRDPDVVQRTLAAGERFVPDGGEGGFSVVLDGALAVHLQRREGGGTVLEVLGSGDCVPQSPGVAAITLVALVDSAVARVPTMSFDRVVRANNSLVSAIGAKLAVQHEQLVARLAALSQHDPSRRLASGLIYLAGKLGHSCPLAPGMRVPLAQSVIAQVADVSRQTANRTLRDWQSRGIVRIERAQVCVLHREDLESLAAGASVESKWMPVATCKFAHPTFPLTCFTIGPLRPPPEESSGKRTS